MTNNSPYSQLYEGVDDLWGSEPGRLMPAVLKSAIGRQALDLGCGEGRNAVWLARQGFNVRAIDSDPLALSRLHNRIMNEHLEKSIRVVEGSVQKSTLTDFFDVILTYGLLHCLNEDELSLVFDFASSQKSGCIFAGSALTDELPIPENHRSGRLYLRPPSYYKDVLAEKDLEVFYWEEGIIVEDHLPVVAEHRHSSVWFVATVG